MPSTILGLGHYLPAEVERVGVRRPIAVQAVGASTLAVQAAGAALGQAGGDADAVDFIVFATMTPDVAFPGSACYFQDQMHCGTVGALDIRAQCAGFVFGLAVADQFVRAGVYGRVLVIGAEVHSAGLDYSERGARIARLYGDGAGAALIGGTAASGTAASSTATGNSAAGIRAAVLHSDGRHHQRFWCEYPASRQHPVRMTAENFRAGRHFPQIDFEAVRRFGEECLPAVIGEALHAAALKPEHVDRYIIAHLLPEVGEAAAVQLGIASARVNIPAARYGHLTAAALPVALSDEVTRGRLGPGATVCLAAAGAGYAWGAAVVTL